MNKDPFKPAKEIEQGLADFNAEKEGAPKTEWEPVDEFTDTNFYPSSPTDLHRHVVEYTKDGIDVHLEFNYAITETNGGHRIMAWCYQSFRTDYQSGWFYSPRCHGHDGREFISDDSPCDVKTALAQAAFDAHWAVTFGKDELSKRLGQVLTSPEIPDDDAFTDFDTKANAYAKEHADEAHVRYTTVQTK